MFFRLSTERADLVTIRDFGNAAEVAGALRGYGLAIEDAALAADLAKGPWNATVQQDGTDITLSVSALSRPS